MRGFKILFLALLGKTFSILRVLFTDQGVLPTATIFSSV